MRGTCEFTSGYN
jgi:hypothetical protein